MFSRPPGVLLQSATARRAEALAKADRLWSPLVGYGLPTMAFDEGGSPTDAPGEGWLKTNQKMN